METKEHEPNLKQNDSDEEITNLLVGCLIDGQTWDEIKSAETDGQSSIPGTEITRRYHLSDDCAGTLKGKAERQDIITIVKKYPDGFQEGADLNFLDLAAEQYQLRTASLREENDADIRRQQTTDEFIRRLAAEEEGQRRAAEIAERRRRMAAIRELQNRLDNGEHISMMNRALEACERGDWQEALQYAYKSRALKPMLGTEYVLAVASSYTGTDTAYGFVMNCVENNFRAAEAQLAYYMNRGYGEADPQKALLAAQAAEAEGAKLLARHWAEYLALLAAYGSKSEERQRGRNEFLTAFDQSDLPNHTMLKIANWLYDGEEFPLAEHVYASVNVSRLERGYQTANYYWRLAISEYKNNEHDWIQAHLKNCFYSGMLMEDAKFYSHEELESGVYQAVETPSIFWDFLDPETTAFAKAYFEDRRVFLTGGITASEFYKRHIPDFIDRYVPHDYYYVQGPEGYRLSYEMNNYASSNSGISGLFKRIFKKQKKEPAANLPDETQTDKDT